MRSSHQPPELEYHFHHKTAVLNRMPKALPARLFVMVLLQLKAGKPLAVYLTAAPPMEAYLQYESLTSLMLALVR